MALFTDATSLMIEIYLSDAIKNSTIRHTVEKWKFDTSLKNIETFFLRLSVDSFTVSVSREFFYSQVSTNC